MHKSRLCSTVEKLKSSPIAVCESYSIVIRAIIAALKEWECEGENQANFIRTIIGMKNLLREIEESIEPLAFLSEILSDTEDDITVVDLCSGKGVFSMLARQTASKLAGTMRIKKIIMIDKQTKGKINLSHLHGLDTDNFPSIEFHDFDIHSKDFLQVCQI